MKYIYIGTNEVRLFIECDSMNVYKIPLGVSLPKRDELIYTICYAVFIFSIPLTYKLTQSFYAVIAELFASTFLAVLILKIYQERTARDYERWIAQKPYFKEDDYNTVMNTYRKYVIKNILGCFVAAVVIICFLIGGLFFFYYFDPPGYRLLLALNAPSELVIILGGLKPIQTIRYYFKMKRLAK